MRWPRLGDTTVKMHIVVVPAAFFMDGILAILDSYLHSLPLGASQKYLLSVTTTLSHGTPNHSLLLKASLRLG